MEAIIRGGLRKYTDQLGHLWNSLADYYVRSGLFERVSIHLINLNIHFLKMYFYNKFFDLGQRYI